MRLSSVIVFSTLVTFASAYNCMSFSDNDSNYYCTPIIGCPALWLDYQEASERSHEHLAAFTNYLNGLTCGSVQNIKFISCPMFQIPITDFNNPWMKRLNYNTYRVMKAPKNFNCTNILPPISVKTSFSPKAPPQVAQKPNFEIVQSQSFEIHENENVNKNLYAQCGRDLNQNHGFGKLTELSDFPWLALLEFDTFEDEKKSLCGGVLISNQYVLTAAHCVTSRANNLTGVILGAYDMEEDESCISDCDSADTSTCENTSIVIGVDRVIVHEGYNTGISHRENDYEKNDLALVKLNKKITFTPYIQPICLPTSEPMKEKYFVAGWSKSMVPNAKGMTEKRVSKLTMIDIDACTNIDTLPFVDKDQHICAGKNGTNEKPCVGDSGGPLMGYQKQLDGSLRITVYGISYSDVVCDKSGLPGVYTRIYEFKSWIIKNISN